MAAPLISQRAQSTPHAQSDFPVLWAAQALSRFGDPITVVSITALAFHVTGSAFVTSLAVVVSLVPPATVGFLGGSIADAIGLRRAMVLCDLARTALTAAIPLAVAAGLPLAVPFALVLAAAFFASVFNPARVAILPLVVSSPRLARSNSLLYATDRSVEVVGALAGGVLFAAFGAGAFYVDAATFFLSALLLTRLRIEETRAPLRIAALLRDVRAALTFIRRNNVLYANTIASLLAQLVVAVANALVPVYIFRRFANGNAELGAQQFGATEAAIALGAVVMGAVFTQAFLGIGKGRLLLIGWALYGALYVAISVVPTFEAVLLLFFAAGAVNVLFYVPNVTIWQELVPERIRGAVFGTRMSLLSVTWLPTMAVAGIAADWVAVEYLLAVVGAFTVAVAAFGARIPLLRDVP